MTYQGHRNRNAWNVALYLNNDESNYRLCQHYMSQRQRGAMTTDQACEMIFMRLPSHTPDGVRYTRTNVRLALQHWEG